MHKSEKDERNTRLVPSGNLFWSIVDVWDWTSLIIVRASLRNEHVQLGNLAQSLPILHGALDILYILAAEVRYWRERCVYTSIMETWMIWFQISAGIKGLVCNLIQFVQMSETKWSHRQHHHYKPTYRGNQGTSRSSSTSVLLHFIRYYLSEGFNLQLLRISANKPSVLPSPTRPTKSIQMWKASDPLQEGIRRKKRAKQVTDLTEGRDSMCVRLTLCFWKIDNTFIKDPGVLSISVSSDTRGCSCTYIKYAKDRYCCSHQWAAHTKCEAAGGRLLSQKFEIESEAYLNVASGGTAI